MVAAVIRTLSPRRFETYLLEAGHDVQRAMALYEWNARIGASFHIPIQAAEVALRNRVNQALMAEFGRDWWRDLKFLEIIEHDRDIATVKSRIEHMRLKLETDQIVAGLSFGFWVGMLKPKYNPPIWGKHLRAAFPYLPKEAGRQELFKLSGAVAKFRNRISHHEPLIKDNVSQAHSDVIKLILWICPDTASWVRPLCEAPKIIRQKP